jgi:ligand-binding sensor domain-containing protein
VVTCIAIDSSGNTWIGTEQNWLAKNPESQKGGVAKFDGDTWTIYDITNSGLPKNDIATITIDPFNNVWVGTNEGGAAKFDGNNWTVYNESYAEVLSYAVESIKFDSEGNVWFATRNGAAKYDGSTWTEYTDQNSGMSMFGVRAMDIDNYGNIWFGTYDGALKFDGSEWILYNTSNSGLPGKAIRSIYNDSKGNIWFATEEDGIAVYNADGFVGISEVNPPVSNYYLSQNYPNPFNPTTTIEYSLPVSSKQSAVSSWQRSENRYQNSENQNQNQASSLPAGQAGNQYLESSIQVHSFNQPITQSGTGGLLSVKLVVYNILGREVATLVNEKQKPGSYSVAFDAGHLSSGVYFYKLSAGNYVKTMKMILLK